MLKGSVNLLCDLDIFGMVSVGDKGIVVIVRTDNLPP